MVEKELKIEPDKVLFRLYIQEVKPSKWVSTKNSLGYIEYHCSKCNSCLLLDSKNSQSYSYCPYCSAKMNRKERKWLNG